MRLLLTLILSIEFSIHAVFGLNCAQCSGFSNGYPDKNAVSSCNNRNNNCATPNFCVKIVDPIVKSKNYITFKSDCYFANSISSQANNTAIENNKCYPIMDNGNPPKQFLYCFCNDRDYCNFVSKTHLSVTSFLVAIAIYFVQF
ncbi:hypothetical protein M3Y95_00559900 [Aphelenchoides besseyi]|nr:hypothetical protein M3Y95_00559900 [Aphelenchoides besseyi]